MEDKHKTKKQPNTVRKQDWKYYLCCVEGVQSFVYLILEKEKKVIGNKVPKWPIFWSNPQYKEQIISQLYYQETRLDNKLVADENY